jgi:hypothetical protein
MLLAFAACAAPAETQVLVHTGDGMLVAISPDADGKWNVMPKHADVTLDVGERWAAVSVCPFAGASLVGVEYYRRDDSAEVTLPCRADATPMTSIPTTLVGTSLAMVALGPYGAELITASDNVISAPHGTWSLAAIEQTANPRAVIRRGVIVDSGTPASLSIDFDTDGFAMDERAVGVDGSLGQDSLYASTYLDGTSLLMPEPSFPPAGAVEVVPSDRLTAGDVQTISGTSSRADGAFVAVSEIPFAADPIQVHFPAPLDSAAISGAAALAATWTTHDSWDEVSLSANFGDVHGLPEWLVDDYDTSTATISFPSLAAIPGWDPTWDLDPTAQTEAGLTLFQQLDHGYRSSGLWKSLN